MYELLVSYCVDQTIDAFSILSLVYIVTFNFFRNEFPVFLPKVSYLKRLQRLSAVVTITIMSYSHNYIVFI